MADHMMTATAVLGATAGEYVWVVEDIAAVARVKREAAALGWTSTGLGRMERRPARLRILALTTSCSELAGLELRGWCASVDVPERLRREIERRCWLGEVVVATRAQEREAEELGWRRSADPTDPQLLAWALAELRTTREALFACLRDITRPQIVVLSDVPRSTDDRN